MTNMRDVRAIASEYDVLRQRLKVARFAYRRLLRIGRRSGDNELQASIRAQACQDVVAFVAALKQEEVRAAERADGNHDEEDAAEHGA